MRENENIEFIEEYTEKIYKEIVTFLNTNSGTIYVGYDDDGSLIGLENCKETEKDYIIIKYIEKMNILLEKVQRC